MSDDNVNIPSISARAAEASPVQHYNSMSFALASSLAAAKRMRWIQTPWLNAALDRSVCKELEPYISLQLGKDIPWIALHHAILLGETYEDGSTNNQAPGPQILVVFPHLTRRICTDPVFVKFWHNKVVAPAFDMAWEESGLVTARGGWFVGKIPIVPATRHHAKQAVPAAGLLRHLENRSTHRVSVAWPEERGGEVRFSEMYHDAWKSIKGMIDGIPGAEELREPFLLLVDTSRIDLSHSMSIQLAYQTVGAKWDRSIDSRYVLSGSFKVMIQTLIGDRNQISDSLDEEEQEATTALRGVQFKRMAGESEGEKERGAKRRKKD